MIDYITEMRPNRSPIKKRRFKPELCSRAVPAGATEREVPAERKEKGQGGEALPGGKRGGWGYFTPGLPMEMKRLEPERSRSFRSTEFSATVTVANFSHPPATMSAVV